MSALISFILWNACWGVGLAILVDLLERLAFFQRRPALLHLMWFGVLLRLVVPSVLAIPILPDTSVKLRLEADFTQVVPQNISLDVVPVVVPDQNLTVESRTVSALSWWTFAGWSVGAIWIAGTIWHAGHCLSRWFRFYRVVARAEPSPLQLSVQAASLAREYGLGNCPDVLVVDDLVSPAIWLGNWRVVILVPRHLIDAFDEEQWACVLSHELAHLSRRDYLVNLIAAGILYLYWWNPVAWWAWRELRASQEASCDAWALSHETVPRRRYAETLIQVVDLLSTNIHSPAQVALGFGDQTVLTRRIQMIADPTVRPHMAWLSVVCVALLALFLLCIPVRADKPAQASPTVVAEAAKPLEKSKRSKLVTLKYDDGKADGKRSIAGTGMMVQFEKPEGQYQLKSLKLHCARYGTPAPPKEDVTFSILSEDGSEVLHTEVVPYAKFKRGECLWTTIAFQAPVDVPEKFWVVAEFNAERTKGVYLSYDTSSGGTHSKVGLPGQESSEVTTGGDWMIQAILASSTPE